MVRAGVLPALILPAALAAGPALGQPPPACQPTPPQKALLDQTRPRISRLPTAREIGKVTNPEGREPWRPAGRGLWSIRVGADGRVLSAAPVCMGAARPDQYRHDAQG